MVTDPLVINVSSGQAMTTAPVAAPLGTSTVRAVAVALVTGPAMVEPPREVKATWGLLWPFAPNRSVPLMVTVLPMTPLEVIDVGFSVIVWTPSTLNLGSLPGTRMVASTPPATRFRVAQGATGSCAAHFFRYAGGGVAPSKQILMPRVEVGPAMRSVTLTSVEGTKVELKEVTFEATTRKPLDEQASWSEPVVTVSVPVADPPEGTVTVTVWAGAVGVDGAATAAWQVLSVEQDATAMTTLVDAVARDDPLRLTVWPVKTRVVEAPTASVTVTVAVHAGEEIVPAQIPVA